MASSRGVAHGLRVWGALWRVRALHELHYRANLVVHVVQVLFDLAIGIVAIRLVFSNVEELNGWSEPELLVVLGTFTMLGAFIQAVVLPNMWRVVDDVQDGSFDAVLVMPADEQIFVTARELSVWDLSGVLIGAALTVYGASGTDAVEWRHGLLYVALLPAAAAIVYGFFLAVTSLAFRLVDLRDLLFRLFQGSEYSGRWPIGLYPNWLRIVLTVTVPIGAAVTIPSAALTGRMGWEVVLVAVSGAIATLLASRWIFIRAIRAYSGASA